MLEWWEAAKADPEHVLFLHYEAMLSEPEVHIRKIAEFAEIDHTPEIIAKVKSPFLERCHKVVRYLHFEHKCFRGR